MADWAEYPILEHDMDTKALIEPWEAITRRDLPEHCVICFFREVLEKLLIEHNGRMRKHLKTEMGEHMMVEIVMDGQKVIVFHSGVGAPLAAGLMEELIARGARKFIACGGCGILDPDAVHDSILVPSVAVRDEGTSYHYLPPSREIEGDPRGVEAIETVLGNHNLPYLNVKTWTTDSYYRKTADKIAMRLQEGCTCVEMETAAFFAVSHFRQVAFGQLLYAGDVPSGNEWNPQGVMTERKIREELFWLAAESCLLL